MLFSIKSSEVNNGSLSIPLNHIKPSSSGLIKPFFILISSLKANFLKISGKFIPASVKNLTVVKNLDIFKDNSNSIILIEWPQIIDKKPKNLIELIFSYEKDYEKRSVEIKGLNL